MTAFRIVVIILIFTLFSGCGPELRKPVVKKAPIVKKEPSLLESLTKETFAIKNAEDIDYFQPIPAIYKDKLLYKKSGSDGTTVLSLTAIDTGKDIWSTPFNPFDNQYIIKNGHLFGSTIIDLDTGKSILDCEKELGVILRKQNTHILDSSTAIIFNGIDSVFKIDYLVGKILWKIQDKKMKFFPFEIKDITKVNDICIFNLDLLWGKPDGLIDLQYHCKSDFGYRGLVTINIKSGKIALAAKVHDMCINNDKIIYVDTDGLHCFDTITEKELWSIQTCKDNCTCGNMIYGNYKTNVIAPLENGITSIDCSTGKTSWVYAIDDPSYWTNKGKIEKNILTFKLDIGKYFIKDRDGEGYTNYHYCYDYKLDLNTGDVFDKQLAKDDTGKDEVIVNKQNTINGITISIKQNLSKKDKTKSRSVISFTDAKSTTTFEYKGNDEIPLYTIEMHEIYGVYYGYRSVYDIFYGCLVNIRKEGEKFIVTNIPCNEIIFEKNKSPIARETHDCEEHKYRKIQVGNDSYELAKNYLSRISNGKRVWEIKVGLYLYDDQLPYFNEQYIAFSGNDGIKLIDNYSGNEKCLMQTYFLRDVTSVEKTKRIEYLITNQDSLLLHKLKNALIILE